MRAAEVSILNDFARASGHVFISYVREDSAGADRLQRILEQAGLPVWRDTAQLWPGQDWRSEIRHAIADDALIFLACFSSSSVSRATSYQNEELTLAIEQVRLRPADRSWLIPVRLDDCQIPHRDLGGGRTLASIQRADLFGDSNDRNATRLVEAIRRILGHQARPAHNPTSGSEPAGLGELILSSVIQRPMALSELADRRIAAAERQENQAGWYLSQMGGPRFLADEAWPVRHHRHHVGYLLWTRDPAGWDIAVPDGRWVDEGQDEHTGCMRRWPYRNIDAPPAYRAHGRGRKWADPADILVALAKWHYCPRAALATLFDLVGEGARADEASRAIYLAPAVGKRIVRRAQRVSKATGLPLHKQIDDLLPIRESDWEAGII